MGSSLDLTRALWRKSSYSGSSGGECVEVADLTPHIAVRDSKNPGVGILALSPEAYTAFVGAVAGLQVSNVFGIRE
ncbi:DUF397 domain-containing protein [Streptomyces fulvoviolaceus]|uniref:DUF397 domain-containing protein n=1 Tax=Streptomyces fulvoviolaceus TaxID=285535 RepID=UPI000693E57A|nr:DUF397 domain-containing protein [Streptomyces fulvoviolaceus]MCT9075052.1 DUF397 domain-containing protein [Streptomyces fulvoviolaceus]